MIRLLLAFLLISLTLSAPAWADYRSEKVIGGMTRGEFYRWKKDASHAAQGAGLCAGASAIAQAFDAPPFVHWLLMAGAISAIVAIEAQDPNGGSLRDVVSKEAGCFFGTGVLWAGVHHTREYIDQRVEQQIRVKSAPDPLRPETWEIVQ